MHDLPSLPGPDRFPQPPAVELQPATDSLPTRSEPGPDRPSVEASDFTRQTPQIGGYAIRAAAAGETPGSDDRPPNTADNSNPVEPTTNPVDVEREHDTPAAARQIPAAAPTAPQRPEPVFEITDATYGELNGEPILVSVTVEGGSIDRVVDRDPESSQLVSPGGTLTVEPGFRGQGRGEFLMRHAARELTARGVERWDANFISPQAVHIADRVFGDENIAYYDAETGQHLPMTTDQAAASVERVVEQTHGGDDVDEVEDCSIQARIDLANYQDRPEGIAPAADRPQPQFASRTRYQPTLEDGQDVLFVDVKGGEMSRTVIRDQQTGELVSDSGSINVRAGYSSQGREEYLFRQTAAELASRGVERWDSNIARPDLVRTAARVFGDERMAYYDYDPHDATNTEIPLPMTTDQAAASAGRIPGKSPEGVRAHVDLRGFPTDTATPDNANRLVRQTDAYVEAIDIGQNEITANRAHPDQALVDGIIARAAAGVTTETMHPTHSKPDHRNGNRTYYVDQADNPTIFAKQTQLRQRADGSTKPLGDAEVMHAHLVGRVLDTVEAQVIVRAEGYEGVSYVPPLAAVHNAETQTETIFYPWQEGRQLEESGDMEEIEPTPPDSELARLDRIGYALVDLFQANGIISEDFSDQHFLISTDEWGRVSLHVIDTEGFEITRPAQ